MTGTILRLITITKTMSIVLSSWQSHCESSLGSSEWIIPTSNKFQSYRSAAHHRCTVIKNKDTIGTPSDITSSIDNNLLGQNFIHTTLKRSTSINKQTKGKNWRRQQTINCTNQKTKCDVQLTLAFKERILPRPSPTGISLVPPYLESTLRKKLLIASS